MRAPSPVGPADRRWISAHRANRPADPAGSLITCLSGWTRSLLGRSTTCCFPPRWRGCDRPANRSTTGRRPTATGLRVDPPWRRSPGRTRAADHGPTGSRSRWSPTGRWSDRPPGRSARAPTGVLPDRAPRRCTPSQWPAGARFHRSAAGPSRWMTTRSTRPSLSRSPAATPRPTTRRAKYEAASAGAAIVNRPPARPQKKSAGWAIGLLAHGRSSTWPLATNRSSRPSLSASKAASPNPVLGAARRVEARAEGRVDEQPPAQVAKERVRLVDQVGDEQVDPAVAVQVVGDDAHAGRRAARPVGGRPRPRVRPPRSASRPGSGTGSWAMRRSPRRCRAGRRRRSPRSPGPARDRRERRNPTLGSPR